MSRWWHATECNQNSRLAIKVEQWKQPNRSERYPLKRSNENAYEEYTLLRNKLVRDYIPIWQQTNNTERWKQLRVMKRSSSLLCVLQCQIFFYEIYLSSLISHFPFSWCCPFTYTLFLKYVQNNITRGCLWRVRWTINLLDSTRGQLVNNKAQRNILYKVMIPNKTLYMMFNVLSFPA